ncbi:MAG: hypothetical protein F6J93_36615 [Oscillatoria sp. SIO1A7]|nr:hypothetical protein [Oscillatoria sp. SIO1A7]
MREEAIAYFYIKEPSIAFLALDVRLPPAKHPRTEVVVLRPRLSWGCCRPYISHPDRLLHLFENRYIPEPKSDRTLPYRSRQRAIAFLEEIVKWITN